MPKYIIVTEAALDAALVSSAFSNTSGLPETTNGVYGILVSDEIIGFRVRHQREPTFFGAVSTDWINILLGAGGTPVEVFQRIARVLKGLKSPPVHLPRQWSEYHHRNLLSFFALPRDVANFRWIVELGGAEKIASFDSLTSDADEVDLSRFNPMDTAAKFVDAAKLLIEAEIPNDEEEAPEALAQEVDLQAIGSNSVVAGRTYEDWKRHLTPEQLQILGNSIDTSVRIVGPAGSGKTLSLCMRALQIATDPNVLSQGKRVLVATHSWAMSERIDGILSTLNAGLPPEGVTVFPLLSLLELHAGHIGQHRTEIIGDDSTDGRVRSLEIIGGVVSKIDVSKFSDVSEHLIEGLLSKDDGRSRIDLIINLYEEISGVLAASGVAPDDPNAIQDYMTSKREDWMPPFDTIADRGFAIAVYRQFIQNLVDRAAITTDQFVLDSIRVLETFTWRMKKETEGYDYIIVDELQLFDPQERSALELLGRSRKGVPFVTAEDPSQGVFAALNMRRANVDNVPVYLDTVHRFNRQIFDFINFLYQQFPLNALPLKISDKKEQGGSRPILISCKSDEAAILTTGETVEILARDAESGQRICVVTLGDVDEQLVSNLDDRGLVVTRLESFDDIEQLSYRKRSIVVSPWQFIGGTQFAHVLVLALGIKEQTSQFGRLREMIAVYLSCSRAADTLRVICAGYIPPVIAEAREQGLLEEYEYN
jgi:hypothetical protein